MSRLSGLDAARARAARRTTGGHSDSQGPDPGHSDSSQPGPRSVPGDSGATSVHRQSTDTDCLWYGAAQCGRSERPHIVKQRLGRTARPLATAPAAAVRHQLRPSTVRCLDAPVHFYDLPHAAPTCRQDRQHMWRALLRWPGSLVVFAPATRARAFPRLKGRVPRGRTTQADDGRGTHQLSTVPVAYLTVSGLALSLRECNLARTPGLRAAICANDASLDRLYKPATA